MATWEGRKSPQSESSYHESEDLLIGSFFGHSEEESMAVSTRISGVSAFALQSDMLVFVFSLISAGADFSPV